MCLDVRVESLEAGAPMQADASHDDDHEGDEETQLNETLERSSYPTKKKETLVGGVTGGVDTPTVSEGRSKGTETVIDNTTLPIAVESTERDQLRNLHHIPPENGRESFVLATAVAAIVAAAIASAATALAGRSKQNVSTLVVQHDCPSIEHDIEKGHLSTGAIAGEDAPGYHHQHNDDERDCRICQLSSTDLVINLGCACVRELGRAHLVCALTWFQSRRNRECEICGAIPKSVHIQQLYDGIAIENRLEAIDLIRMQWSVRSTLDGIYSALVDFIDDQLYAIIGVAFVIGFILACLLGDKHSKGHFTPSSG